MLNLHVSEPDSEIPASANTVVCLTVMFVIPLVTVYLLYVYETLYDLCVESGLKAKQVYKKMQFYYRKM